MRNYLLVITAGLFFGASILPAISVVQSFAARLTQDSDAATAELAQSATSSNETNKTELTRTYASADSPFAPSVRWLRETWSDGVESLRPALYVEQDVAVEQPAPAPAALPTEVAQVETYSAQSPARRELLASNMAAYRARLAAVRKDTNYRVREDRKNLALQQAEAAKASELPTTSAPVAADQAYGMSGYGPSAYGPGYRYGQSPAADANLANGNPAAANATWANTWDGYRPSTYNAGFTGQSYRARTGFGTGFGTSYGSSFGIGNFGWGGGFYGGYNGCCQNNCCNYGCGPVVYYGGYRPPGFGTLVNQPFWTVKNK